MSSVISGLVGAIATVALVTAAKRKQKPAQANSDGWKTLRAGPLLNGTIIGCTGLAALIGYILLSGGSTRPDAATQNTIALLLAIGFGACAFYTAWASYGRTIMWKGNEVRIRTSFGHEIVHRISDVSSVSEMRDEYRLTFRDGSSLRLSAYFHGAKELVEALPQRAFCD